jgi:transposase
MSKAAEWEVRVADWRASGLTAKEFCLEREYSAQNLLYWSSTLQRRDREQPRAGRDVTLARVVRRERAGPTRKAPAAIVVRTRTARVEVRPGADATTLAVVLGALGVVGSAS